MGALFICPLIVIYFFLGISCVREFKTSKNIKLNLNKYSKDDDITIISAPLIDDTSDIDICNDLICEDKYKDTIKIFYNKLFEICSLDDLKNLRRNIISLKFNKLLIKERIKEVIFKGCLLKGYYDKKCNNISIKRNSLITFIHELLHCSSTYYDKKKNILYSGFKQDYIRNGKNVSFGLGINEGVTQYFTEAKFKDICKDRSITDNMSYFCEKKIAKALSIIFGEKKLLSMYLRCDLLSLFNGLCKYNTRENVIKFIRYTDIICEYQVGYNFDCKGLDEAKAFVNIFLIKAIILSFNEKGECVDNSLIEKYLLDDSIKPYGYSRKYKSIDYDKIRNELDNISDKSFKIVKKIG